MDLFGSFNEIIDDKFIKSFKEYLDETHSNIEAGVNGIFYVFTAGLIRRSYSEMSSGMLYKQIKANAKDVELPIELSSLFSNEDQLKSVEETGSKIISQLFPAYRSPLISTITTYSGMSKNATSIASRIVANVLVQLFNKEIEEKKWTVDDMVSSIRVHHETLLEVIPEDFMEIMIPSLGLQDLLKAKPYIAKKEKSREQLLVTENEESSQEKMMDYSSTSDSKKSSLWMILGALGLIAILGGVFYLTQNDGFEFLKKQNTPVESTEIEEEEFFQEDSLELERLNNFLSLKDYISDENEAAGKEFKFDSITFDSTSINTESIIVIDSMATLMNNNPEMQIRITAHKPGEAGTFKINRAFAIKKYLMDNGIDDIRIDPTSGSDDEEKLIIKVVKK